MSTLAYADSRLYDNVLAETIFDPAVTVAGMVVVADDGTITLDGTATSYSARLAAEESARRVLGVRNVVNNIVVDPELFGNYPDDDIANDLRNRLDKDFLVPKERVSVAVTDGVATLAGTVDWHYQREAAKEEAEDTDGVFKVNNLIEIGHSPASKADIMSDIRKALVRNAQTEADNIRVAADNGHVWLSGTARTFAEQNEAEDIAWRAKGVTAVTNDIVIAPL